ncbi:PPOX class F420-dependent oxidoreductase [Gordonia sp. PKS22-38]|uniref:PPOX class F420-dependent oxidoreductase n=1 Tax=Gordonia prachuapensis TaxID=3115651 RepID=A0ABU7MVH2_9ACTN|nr:PPOX class F420-dependent oxidoreductase [Gordonia sp. PKS22-38]
MPTQMTERKLSDPDVLEYLATQKLGRLATVDRHGAPQNNAVGFWVNEELGTIDIGGMSLSTSRKFRNLTHNDRVAFVVDDLASVKPWRPRMVEIRGRGEQITDAPSPRPGMDSSLIRVHPERVIAFGITD